MNALFIFLVALFFLVSILYWKSTGGFHKKLMGYVSIISGVALSLAFITVVIEQNKYIENSKDALIEHGIIDILTMLQRGGKYTFELFQQMNSNDPTIASISIPKVDDRTLQDLKVNTSCQIILRRIEQSHNEAKDNNELIRIWKQWFKSSILRNVWNNYKVYFSTSMISFIDNVILG